MNKQLQTQMKAAAALAPSFTPVPIGLLQRKCACGRSPGVTGECEACSSNKLTMQRRASNQAEPSAVPPIVYDALRSPGQPLDADIRTFMETRFGHDFSRVAIHTNTKAAESTRAVNALAYTVGRDVVFGEGQYAPYTHAGQQLLAHELAHTVQQSGQKSALTLEVTSPGSSAEQEADDVVRAVPQGGVFYPAHRTPVQIARQKRPAGTQTPAQAATPAAVQPMMRAEFDKVMKDRYGVTDIRTGTFQDQAFDDMKQEDWKAWDPGSSSTVYNWIIEAFVNFEKAFGGLPPVKKIIFFDAEYHRGDQGNAVRSSDIGASYDLGRLIIYRAVQQGNKMFNLQGVLESPTPEQAVKRNITHELGHGIAETALTQGTDKPPGADPDLFKDYRRAVGWTQDGKLYDIQETVVQDAFKNNITPPAQFQIKPENVDTKPWKERPVTHYMADNPGDDFAEAIMAYANEPQRLKALSPTRYDFIDKRKGRWLASGQPKVNIWEQVKRGGPARTLQPSRPPTIWERAKEAK